jgi:hypothetical protein
MRVPVSPPLLWTLLLAWTLRIAHQPLSPMSFWALPLKPQGRCLNPTIPVAVPRYLAYLVLRIVSVTMTSPPLVYMSCSLAIYAAAASL